MRTTVVPIAEPPRYDEEIGGHVARYDTDSDVPISVVLVDVVAEIVDEDALAMPPLIESVDPGPLDALFAAGNRALTVEFDYADHRVQLDDDGEIRAIPH